MCEDTRHPAFRDGIALLKFVAASVGERAASRSIGGELQQSFTYGDR